MPTILLMLLLLWWLWNLLTALTLLLLLTRLLLLTSLPIQPTLRLLPQSVGIVGDQLFLFVGVTHRHDVGWFLMLLLRILRWRLLRWL